MLGENLHHLSMNLRALEISATSVPLDFLFPLGEVPVLPSGECLFNSNPKDWDDDEIEDRTTGGSPYSKISIYARTGYAARRMPVLATLTFCLARGQFLDFDYDRGSSSGTATITWESVTGYKPDDRVARAWGYKVEELDVHDGGVQDDNEHFIKSVI
ncbi:hypothetical protein BJX99DRAFT_264702 [Aspergillus californicus]